MKKTYLLFLLLTFIFAACSSDDKQDPLADDIEITASVRCKIKGVEIAELRAPMLLFTYFDNVQDYEFNTDQSIFIHKTTGEKRNPQKKEYTNDKGLVKISDSKGAKNCIIVIQSSQYPDQYELKKYEEIKGGSRLNIGNFLFTD